MLYYFLLYNYLLLKLSDSFTINMGGMAKKKAISNTLKHIA